MKHLLLLAATAASFTSSLAQTPSASSTPTPSHSSSKTSSIAAATHTVSAGLNHAFEPDVINANVGDVIHFEFFPKNHSVAKAQFKNPCIPYNYAVPGGEMFFSGPMESNPGDEPPTWDVTVNNTEPTFFYCTAPGSCMNSSMVGVINPNKSQTLQIQKQYVEYVKFELSPGEDFPDESPPAPLPPSSTTVPTTQPTSSTTPSTEQPAADGGSGSGLSAGAIAGIAIGAAALLLIAIALVYICGRKGGFEKGYRRSTAAPSNPAPMIEAAYPDLIYDPNKPTGPPSSPYGAQTETWRSSTTHGHLSPPMGSPHTSYMGYGNTNGFSPQHTGHSAELSAQYDPPYSPPPVELPGNQQPASPSTQAPR